MLHAFTGQDSVVLSLSHASDHRSTALAEASIKAGVKQFIANAYGGSDSLEAESFFHIPEMKGRKKRELKVLERERWSWSAIQCGLFFDFCIRTGFFGINSETETASLLDAYKEVTGVTEWDVTYFDADEEVQSAKRELQATGSIWAMAKLALLSEVKEGVRGNFAKEGILDTDVLGLGETESVEQTVARVLKEGTIKI
ncbi:hypothetical protein K469DRAFT_694169 [Zopfia rhizophila CBS 207.26]|uniref:NmrA-like domain-containing protein n=1 Tax=Zopfia rhizophila CBS 207.26 TaxID=1314779 RepID=A0A6A6DLX6_9PEZI|nr:hypothetical protein K469DRAFT_694169 [Zopfia rhizophila CBS 207.26]